MILIVGIGYVGEALLVSYLEDGVDCVGITLNEKRAEILSEKYNDKVYSADIRNLNSLETLLTENPIEPTVIINCTSSNRGGIEAYQKVFVEGNKNLLQIFDPEYYLFTSSTSVYRQSEGEMVNEATSLEVTTPSSALLLEAEQKVLLSPVKSSVLRLGGIYGPNRSYFLQKFLKGEATIDFPPEEGRWLNQIHRDDVVSAIKFVINKREEGVINCVDSKALTQNEVYNVLIEKFDKEFPPKQKPNIEGKRGWTNKQVVPAILNQLGWSPTYKTWLDVLEDDEFVSSIVSKIESL